MGRLSFSSSKTLRPSFSLCFFNIIFFLFSSAVAFNLSTVSFDENYSPLFGERNLIQSPDGLNIRLLLNAYTGSGFISSSMYQYGFFSAKIKLPSDHTAGIVVAFYTSNGAVFEKNHDELDFEFLGNVEGQPWRFQTNLYGNGSTNTGREERYFLWFDPSKEFHRYSILWTAKNIIFYVDDVPIREVVRSEEMGGDYPSKPMSLYATIWDASNWATNGGKNGVDYKYAPFTSEFKDFALEGCRFEPIKESPDAVCSEKAGFLESRDYTVITPKRRTAMRKFRRQYMFYSYCYDKLRYPVPPPECVLVPMEQERFQETGMLKFGGSTRKQIRNSRIRHRKRPRVSTGSDQA
ncbi:hypothetical protein SLE2022_224630 [Rubroshorea leprosula]